MKVANRNNKKKALEWMRSDVGMTVTFMLVMLAIFPQAAGALWFMLSPVFPVFPLMALLFVTTAGTNRSKKDDFF